MDDDRLNLTWLDTSATARTLHQNFLPQGTLEYLNGSVQRAELPGGLVLHSFLAAGDWRALFTKGRGKRYHRNRA